MTVATVREQGLGILASLVLLLATDAGATSATSLAAESRPVDALLDINLGGMPQKVLIQGTNPGRPILLWLHGGPGASAMMLAHAYTGRLRDHFVVVNWDQRGAGLSYYDGMNPDMISEENIIRDALELTQELRRRYSKRKIFLLGHSFGSVVGLRLAQLHPELFHAYVGMGQVIDFERSKALVLEWLERRLLEAQDEQGLARIRQEGQPSPDLIRKYGGYYHAPVDWTAIVRASPYFYGGYLERHARAREFSARNMKSDGSLPPGGSRVTRMELPVFFFEGRHDRVMACAPELVVEYYAALSAPFKKIVWFEGSAHHPNLEEPERFQDVLIDVVLPASGESEPRPTGGDPHAKAGRQDPVIFDPVI